MSKISIIVAADAGNAIGKDNRLLCRMPDDMKRFKELTTGHTVIMGRKTFESLPKGALPNRRNIVLTTDPHKQYADTVSCQDLQEAIGVYKDEEEVFIIGGAMVYKEAMPFADTLYLTRIHHTFEDADTFFPEIDLSQWNVTEQQEFPADEKHAYPFTFLTYTRKLS